MGMELNVQDRIEGKIEKIAFGGEGILRYRGFVIFVPFTAPGDFVTCQIKEVKKSFARAELISIQTLSPYRTTPLCPYFGTCGGCQLQHLIAQEQILYKKEAVKDALKRIGHLKTPDFSVISTELQWNYRRHITLHLKPHLGAFQAGYIGADHYSLVAIKTCPIFNKKEDLIIQQVQELVGTLSNPSQQEGRVTILKNELHQYILSFYFDIPFSVEERVLKHALQNYPLFAGILFKSSNQQLHVGNTYSEQKLEGLTFRFTPQAFIQNHPEQSANIYREIGKLAGDHRELKILDLYCGFGITSLLLAKQKHRVIGIEYNGEAIAFAQENALANRLNQVRFVQGDVNKQVPKIAKEFKPDLILMNPPRQGLSKKIIQTLLLTQPKEMIYVSCMPATLARDLALLCQKDYEIQEGKIYDMFPQTAHVETLIHLVRP